MELLLWIAAVLSYGVGDYITTLLAVKKEGLEEDWFLTRRLLGATPQPIALALLKAGALIVVYLGYAALDNNAYRWLVPASLTGFGVYAVVNNLYLWWTEK